MIKVQLLKSSQYEEGSPLQSTMLAFDTSSPQSRHAVPPECLSQVVWPALPFSNGRLFIICQCILEK